MRQSQRFLYFMKFIRWVVDLAPLDLSEKGLWHRKTKNESLAKVSWTQDDRQEETKKHSEYKYWIEKSLRLSRDFRPKV
jgi:hypothetical protein